MYIYNGGYQGYNPFSLYMYIERENIPGINNSNGQTLSTTCCPVRKTSSCFEAQFKINPVTAIYYRNRKSKLLL